MANEIKVQTSLQCDNGTYKLPKHGGGTLSVTQAAPGGGVPGILTAVATGTGTLIPTTGLATPGYGRYVNLDAAITITIGNVTGGVFYPVAELKAGEEACFRWAAGAVLYAKAASGTPKLQAVVLES